MLIVRVILTAVALLFAVSAWSNDPAPSAWKVSTPQQQKAEKNYDPADGHQRGTDSRPFVIKFANAPQGQPTTESTQSYSTNNSFCNWWPYGPEWSIAIFTLLLVIIGAVTAFVLFCQVRQLQRQVTAMTNEFIVSHRPRIRIKHVSIANDSIAVASPLASIAFVNYGEGTAIIRVCRFRAIVLPPDKYLPTMPNEKMFFNMPFNAAQRNVLAGVTILLANFDIRGGLSQDHFDIQSDGARIYCFGDIEYSDISEKRIMKTAFCRVFKLRDGTNESKIGYFAVENNPDYEYQD
jgi:hypothetical protein